MENVDYFIQALISVGTVVAGPDDLMDGADISVVISPIGADQNCAIKFHDTLNIILKSKNGMVCI